MTPRSLRGARAPAQAAAPPRSLADLLLGPTAAVRGYLVMRGTLLLLAADVWMTLLGPAWRYGAAGFNVPHFSWMRVLPMPTTSAYVGGLALVSGLALLAALLARPPRWLLGLIAALYTWGWSSSMLDSYQHHYLLSWLLASFALFPICDATALFGPPAAGPVPATLPHGLVPRTHALGPKLAWILVAVVYAYTAISKTEPDWIGGAALRNITHDGATIPGALAFASRLGWAGDDFWWLMGHATILVQVVCCAGYLAAVVRDSEASLRGWAARVPSALATLALVSAVSFHVGAEHLGLEIGWFSYYMILVAIASLLPARWLGRIVGWLTWPSRALGSRADGLLHPVVLGTVCLTGVLGLVYAAAEAGLPGVGSGLALAALVAAVVALVAVRGGEPARVALTGAVAMIATALVMTVSLAVGVERFDYWRFAGGDFRRRGETRAALEAYRNALRFAPEHDEGEEEAPAEGAVRETPRERMASRVRALEAALAAEEGR